jgi:hypothetical protein
VAAHPRIQGGGFRGLPTRGRDHAAAAGPEGEVMSMSWSAGSGRTSLRSLPLALAALLGLASAEAAGPAEVADAIATIRSVDREGKNNEKAVGAWKTLAAADAAELPSILAAFDGAHPVALNYLRSAVDAVVQKAGLKSLPLAALDQFVRETKRQPRARRVAYELLVAAEPTRKEALLDLFLDDPSVELRRDAVARELDRAAAALKAGSKDDAKKTFGKAFTAGRDEDQVKLATQNLRTLGVAVDPAKHFGFILDWSLAGPFDNDGLKGFSSEFDPEKSPFSATASYEGKKGKVSWKPINADDDGGVIDFNRLVISEKLVTAYARTVFTAAKAGPVEIRIGTPNAFKIWVNGQQVYARDEYHRGEFFDQYGALVELKEGPNEILVKSCQNEKAMQWEREWRMRLRVCDPTGGAILSTTRPERTVTVAGKSIEAEEEAAQKAAQEKAAKAKKAEKKAEPKKETN